MASNGNTNETNIDEVKDSSRVNVDEGEPLRAETFTVKPVSDPPLSLKGYNWYEAYKEQGYNLYEAYKELTAIDIWKDKERIQLFQSILGVRCTQDSIKVNLDKWQRFGPSKTIRVFYKYASNPILGSWNMDLAFMLMLFYEIGSDIYKIMNSKKMSAKGRNIFVRMISRYNLKFKEAEEPAAEVLTLRRLSLAFPAHSCKYATYRKNWPVTPVNLTDERICVAIEAFGLVIPLETTIDMEFLIKAHAWFQYRLSMVINAKKYKQMTIHQTKEDIMKYINIAMKYTLPVSTTIKIQFLKDKGILGNNNIFHPEIIRYSQKWDENDFTFDDVQTTQAASTTSQSGQQHA